MAGLVLVLWSSCLLLVALVLQQWLRWLVIKLRHNQPGPLPIPVLGNLLHMMTSPAPHRSLSELARRYGPLFYLQLGIVPTVIVSSPAAAHQVLVAHDKSLASRPELMSVRRLLYGIEKMSFLCPYNHYWRSLRKFYSIHMFNARLHQELHIPIFREEILRAITSDVYPESIAASDVNLSKLFSTLVQNILYRIVVDKLPANVSPATTNVHRFTREVERLLSTSRIGEFIPILSFLEYNLNTAMDRCHRSMDAILEGVVRERENLKNVLNDSEPAAADDGKGMQNCLLDIMLASDPPLDRVEMKAMIQELTIGGTTTTATTLEWAMAELLNNERVMRKAVEEVDRVVGKERMVSVEDVKNNKMPYIRAVVKEALRLHPPAPFLLPHCAAETCHVKLAPKQQRQKKIYHNSTSSSSTSSADDRSTHQVVHRIAAGTRVLVNVWAIGRNETTWGSTATQFVPERFLQQELVNGGGLVTGEVDVKVQDFEFGLLPFGSGRRMCPGSAMAMFMLELTIATFLHCFEWRSKERPVDMSEDFGLSLIRRSQLHALPTSFRLAATPAPIITSAHS